MIESFCKKQQYTLVDFEAGETSCSVYSTHLHWLVLIIKGSADEPASTLDRLKCVERDSCGSLVEEETVHASILADLF